MKDDKTSWDEPQDPEEHKGSEEEYSFMQEVIKDEAGIPKKWRNDILRMIIMGLVFGIVACFSFVALKPWLEKKFPENPDQVTIPQEQEEDNSEDIQDEEEPKVVLDANSYKQMLQSLQSVAKDARKSIATVTGLTGDEDWTKETDTKKKSVSGVLIADNGQELLILGKTLPTKDAKIIKITLNDNSQYEGSIKSQSELLGLSVYALQRKNIQAETWSKIAIATLGSSKYIMDGETAIILGKPFGYGDAIGYGIVASNEEYLDTTDGQYQLISTDVSGSGAGSGIIINIRGEVVGIIDVSVLEEDNQNLIAGYGISDIKDVIELMSNGKTVPFIGIHGIDVTADMMNQGLPQGVYVKEVDVDSPAMAAGIQSGDIITHIGDEETVSLLAYHNILMCCSNGDKVTVHGKRQGAAGEYVDIEFTVSVETK